MFKRKEQVHISPDEIPQSFYHTARNLRGRHFSDDTIRRLLIEKGLSADQAWRVVRDLDTTEKNQEKTFRTQIRRMAASRRAFISLIISGVLLIPFLLALMGWNMGTCTTLSLAGGIVGLVSFIINVVDYFV
jgi:hypothetical protein